MSEQTQSTTPIVEDGDKLSVEDILSLDQGDKIEVEGQKIRKTIEDSKLTLDKKTYLGSIHGHDNYLTAVVIDENNKVLFSGDWSDYNIEFVGFCHDEEYKKLTIRRVEKFISGNKQAFVSIRSNGIVANGSSWELEVEDKFKDITYKVQIKQKEE